MSLASEHLDRHGAWSVILRLGRWLLLLALFVAVLALILELIALHFLPGRSTRFLVEGRIGDEPAWVDNPFFSYRFYPARIATPPLPVLALKTPPENTLRVCLLGGSAAMGMPEPAFGLGRLLEAMLKHSYPDRAVEVISMTIDGGNSHVVREMSRDLKRLQPHAVILLLGNDEVAGPFGPASGLGRIHHSSRIARLITLFSRLRLAQLWPAAQQRFFPARVDLAAWRAQEPISLRGRMSPDDRRLLTVQRSFTKNYTAIIQEARQSTPIVIACTVPVNLRDCAPFSTSFLTDETDAQVVRETLRAAIAADAAGDTVKARGLYAQAIQKHPTHAEALFRAGQLALKENRTAEAAELFTRARDSDALRLRADSTLNAIIRECARAQGAYLLDAERVFSVRSAQGIPGRDLFLDHVHYTFEGTHLLATTLIHRMEFLRAFDQEPTARIPDRDTLANELLHNPWGQARQLEAIIRQQLHPPFRRQLSNAETLARLNDAHRYSSERVAALSLDNTRAIFQRRRQHHPGDTWLAVQAAWYLLQAGDAAAAEEHARAAHERLPHRLDLRGLLALTLAYQHKAPEPGIAMIRETEGGAGYYEVTLSIGIGQTLQEHRQYEAALPWLDHAVALDGWNTEAAIAYAETLFDSGRQDEAIDWLEAFARRHPRQPVAWEELAVLHTRRKLRNDWEIATEYFERAEDLAPHRYDRLLKWAWATYEHRAFSKAHRLLARYLSVMPEDPEALELQALLEPRMRFTTEPDPPPATPRRFLP